MLPVLVRKNSCTGTRTGTDLRKFSHRHLHRHHFGAVRQPCRYITGRSICSCTSLFLKQKCTMATSTQANVGPKSTTYVGTYHAIVTSLTLPQPSFPDFGTRPNDTSGLSNLLVAHVLSSNDFLSGHVLEFPSTAAIASLSFLPFTSSKTISTSSTRASHRVLSIPQLLTCN
uniref:Uncharacterized protein n=1 Tax=Ditylenchus dipsaci TaxID=166011 RepID=A0A915D4T3_9BILA